MLEMTQRISIKVIIVFPPPHSALRIRPCDLFKFRIYSKIMNRFSQYSV
jgi:hypothetical protein